MEGFKPFVEIQHWLKENFGMEMKYQAVNKYVKQKFGARSKVARKSHINKDDNAVVVFKKLFEELNHIDYKSVNMYFQDESILGLMTILRRMITAKGVKPIVRKRNGSTRLSIIWFNGRRN